MRKIIYIVICIVLFMGLTGCSDVKEDLQDAKVIISMGFNKGEVFRLDTLSCMESEVYVYLADMQGQYESTFNSTFWSYMNKDRETMGDLLKNNVIANISQIKAMHLLANKRDITLDASEIDHASNAAGTYYSSLSNREMEVLKVDENQLFEMYKEYALANKVYAYIIKDINPEISDDEARTIVVRNIFLKIYSLNGLGDEIEYSEDKKEEAFKTALELKGRLEEGEDFDVLNLEYSDDKKRSYSFGKGDTDLAYEEAAFSLAEGEISEVIVTDHGYYIIQCISSFDLEQTQRNKVKIMEEQKKEVFEKEYLDFVQELPKNLNSESWNNIQLIYSDDLPDTSFFEVYEQYFSQTW